MPRDVCLAKPLTPPLPLCLRSFETKCLGFSFPAFFSQIFSPSSPCPTTFFHPPLVPIPTVFFVLRMCFPGSLIPVLAPSDDFLDVFPFSQHCLNRIVLPFTPFPGNLPAQCLSRFRSIPHHITFCFFWSSPFPERGFPLTGESLLRRLSSFHLALRLSFLPPLRLLFPCFYPFLRPSG